MMPNDATPVTPEQFLALFPPVIDSTILAAFKHCNHYAYRRYVQGLTSTMLEESIHLHFGGCLAKGLEAARRAYYEAGTSQSNAVLRGVEAVIATWGSFNAAPRTQSEQRKTLDACILATTDYFRQWPLDTDPIQVHFHQGQPCIEWSGSLPIPGRYHPVTGEPLVYSGRFDLIGDFGASQWGEDDKSTGQLGANWADQWTLRGQFIGYTWLAREYGMPLAGFVVRGIQPLAHSTNFAQAIVPCPPYLLDRWLQELQRTVDDMITAWGWGETHSPERWKRRFDAGCYSYGRPCEMMPLCVAEHPNDWLHSYRVERWNPLTRTVD